MSDDLTPADLRRVAKAIRKAEAIGRERGRAEGRREAATLLEYAAQLNGSTPHAISILKGEWHEDQHKRNHGQFSSTGGGGSDQLDESPTNPGDPTVSSTPKAGSDQLHPADAKARTLAARIGEVAHAVRERVTGFVRAKYEKLASKYGESGAKAVLAGMIALAPVPLPGTALIPVALAEAVLRIRRAIGGVAKAIGEDFDADALAREALAELYAEMGEELPAGDTGSANTESAPAPAGESDDADPHEALAKALLQHADESLAGGADPAAGIERLRPLFDDPAALASVLAERGADAETVGKCFLAVRKAWSEDSHPRDDHGQFVSSREIRSASRDPARAESLRASVTDPGERAKLESALSGAKVPGRGRVPEGGSAPLSHQEESREHLNLLYGDLVAKVNAGDAAGIDAWQSRAEKMAAVHWREAKSKALAQWDADYAADGHREFAASREQIGLAFKNAEETIRRECREMAAAARKLAARDPSPMGADSNAEGMAPREAFDAAYDHAHASAERHQNQVWDSIEFWRNRLGGKEKGYKLGRYFKGFHPDQPRGDDGRWIKLDDLAAAKSDPKKAEELKNRVTDPTQRAKLDKVLAGKSDITRTKRGQARHEAAGRRTTREEGKAKTAAILSHLGKVGDLKAKLSADDLHDLADHLQSGHPTLADVRAMRHALAGAAQGMASFGGSKRKADMVAALVAHAQNRAFDARVKEHGFDRGEMQGALRTVDAVRGGGPPPRVFGPGAPADEAGVREFAGVLRAALEKATAGRRGGSKGWCYETAMVVRDIFPGAQVWNGEGVAAPGRRVSGDDAGHTVVKLGDHYLDVTADQFGHEAVTVARDLDPGKYRGFEHAPASTLGPDDARARALVGALADAGVAVPDRTHRAVGFTGTDARGREWRGGELAPTPEAPAAKPEPPASEPSLQELETGVKPGGGRRAKFQDPHSRPYRAGEVAAPVAAPAAVAPADTGAVDSEVMSPPPPTPEPTPAPTPPAAKEPHEMTREEYEAHAMAIPKEYGVWNDEVGDDRYAKPVSQTDQLIEKKLKPLLAAATPGAAWPFPPVKVSRTAGPYDLKDGHHRIEVARRRGVRVIPAELTDPRAFGHTKPVNTFVEVDADGSPRVIQPNNESLPPIRVTVPETKPGKKKPDHGKAHRAAVKAALAAGKPVPPEVLKDYPDLAPKATAPAPAPAPAPATPAATKPPKAAPKPAPAVDAAEVHERAGDFTRTKNSEVNAAARAIAGMSQAEAKRQFGPGRSGRDHRRDAVAAMLDRRQMAFRNIRDAGGTVKDKGREHLRAERAGLLDEPMVTADELFGAPAPKPAAPARPAPAPGPTPAPAAAESAAPPESDLGRKLVAIYHATAGSVADLSTIPTAADVVALPAAERRRIAAAVGVSGSDPKAIARAVYDAHGVAHRAAPERESRAPKPAAAAPDPAKVAASAAKVAAAARDPLFRSPAKGPAGDYAHIHAAADARVAELVRTHTPAELRALAKKVTGRAAKTPAEAADALRNEFTAVVGLVESQAV
jgi:hypothetical protein